MIIEQIYKQFVQEHDTDTPEGESAMAAAESNEELWDKLTDAMVSKHRAGFFAGFRAAMQLMQEVAK